ncbi:MAG: PHP domain-containing protein [Clostridiales bacterium]|jgi:predicted metal-dependent phosphoesterase TrpH|nr:PHP domain-containing protein [Clostridiales bacterium]
MRGFDLHVHSTASDGLWTVGKIIKTAKGMGLEGLAITDHDTTAGLDEALRLAEEFNFPLIPGVELSAEWQDLDIHILGYWLDHRQPRLLARLLQLQEARRERCRQIGARLASLGMPIDVDGLLAAAGDSIGRPHIAYAMVNKSYCLSVTDAFRRHIGRGMPAYVPREKFSPYEAVEMVLAAGGVAVLAHPGLTFPDDLLYDLIKLGLGGIEIYHPEHTPGQERKYLKIAGEYGLAYTGGSDFHGRGDRSLGQRVTYQYQLEVLKQKIITSH